MRFNRRGTTCGLATALLGVVALAVGGMALASTVQGPNNPSTVVDDPSAGSIAWGSPQNAAVSDDQFAFFSAFPGSGDSHYLKATDFGFSIPGGATIDGIKVAVEVAGIAPCPESSVGVTDARIVKGGVIGATNKASEGTFEGDNAVFGSGTELWGEMWTPADTNAADFGFVFRIQTSGEGDCSPIFFVDSISISVFYTGCGDGQLGPGEECDDGNLVNGDCCSSTCQFESAACRARRTATSVTVSRRAMGLVPVRARRSTVATTTSARRTRAIP